MADVEPDIFTLIHRTIRDLLRAYGPFAALVEGPNQIDMTHEDFEGFKPNVGPEDTPEVIVFQAEWTQGVFTPSDPGCTRSQAFPVVITGRSLNPTLVNQVKEAFLDALCEGGAKLGLAPRHVVGWSVSGRDSLQGEAPPSGAEVDRRGFRHQAIGTVTVQWKKPLRRIL